MKFVEFSLNGHRGLAIETSEKRLRGILKEQAGYPGDLHKLIAAGNNALEEAGAALADGAEFDPALVSYLPPISNPGKIVCVGLNYPEHAAESNVSPLQISRQFSRVLLQVWSAMECRSFGRLSLRNWITKANWWLSSARPADTSAAKTRCRMWRATQSSTTVQCVTSS